jgi:hypothetical protein
VRCKLLILGVVLACAAAPQAIAADAPPPLIDGSQVADILALVSPLGTATLGSQDDGSPKIFGKLHGQPYTVYFSGCDQASHGDCQNLDLYVGYSGIKPTQDRINAWNRDTRFVRAYLDDQGDAGMDMDVNLAHGVSRDNLASTLALWAALVDKFTAYIGTP